METNSPNLGRQQDAAARKQATPAMETEARGARPQAIQRMSGNFSPSLWGGHPFDAMVRLSRDVDQLMDSMLGSRFGLGRFAQTSLGATTPELWTPRIEVKHLGNAIGISAELPGIGRDAVTIEATNEGLAISGERRQSREAGGAEQGYELTERSYGSFYRSVPLPEGAQVEQAKATMRDGVLEITVPLKQSAQRRKIEITG